MKRVGVDLGASAVRVVEVVGVDAKGRAQVSKAAIEPMPPGAIEGGRIKEPGQVAFALRKAMKAARVSPYGVILGLGSPDSALATVSMPEVTKPSEWASALRVEDQPISPKVPMAQSALSLNRIGSTNPEDGPAAHLLLAAATLRSEVDALVAVCRKAKVTPRAVDLSAGAAFRGLVRVAEDDGSVSTLVDIGATKSTIATRQGMHLRSVRTIEHGGEDITRALMGATGATEDVAETNKRSMRIGLPASGVARSAVAAAISARYGMEEETRVIEEDTSDLAQESLTTSADALIDEIGKAVESDAYQHPATPTQSIVLCGGGSLLQGLPERLHARSGVPAFIGRPWIHVQPGPRTAALMSDGVPDEAAVLGMVCAVGLALWKEFE